MRHTAVLGVTTNIPYLLDILQEPHFQRGETTTNYLAEHFAGWTGEPEPDEEIWLALAAFEAVHGRGGGQPVATPAVGHTAVATPWQLAKDWRNV
ncbi:MAG: hypothetical protein KDD89_14755 [Anaerolineales bacterium]|nr:hypothetical protein [Anaerolineales bacterium]